MEEKYRLAHKFSSHHRGQLEKDMKCGCFFCLVVFSPTKITDWCDDEDTAICPYCSIDSIIGESSGYPITTEFLSQMHKVWF